MIAIPRTVQDSSSDSSQAPIVAELFADRIDQCSTDLELSAVIEAIEKALTNGALTPEMVEGLAANAAARGRIIHDNSRLITFYVAAEELIVRDPHCPCCGYESWGGGGASTCNVCHPPATLQVTRAAA